jgi:CHAT domain-containing protein
VAASLRASAARYRELDTNDERAIRALSAAAMAAYQAADYESAEVQFKELIADLQGRGEEFELSRAHQQDHLAQVMLRQGRYDEAEPLLVEALSVFERTELGEEDTAICLGLLGRLYFQTNRFREAEAVGRRALALFEQLFGEDSLNVAKALDHVAMSLTMRAQSENKKDLAAEAIALGVRAVSIFTANLPPSHPSVFGANQNLIRYRRLHASIGMMYPSGEDDSASEQAAGRSEPRLPKAHPAAVMRLIDAAFNAAMRRDYPDAQAKIGEAAEIAVSAFGESSPLTFHVRVTHIAILRRQCSFLLGEPTGKLSPIEHLHMQMRGHMRRGQAEDDNTELPAVTTDVLTEVRKLIAEALRLIKELIAEAVNEDGTRKAGYIGRLWVGDTHVGDMLEVLHYARLAGVSTSAEACERAILIMQLHGWHSAAEASGTAFDRNEGTPEVRALREEYRTLVLEYEAAVEQIVHRTIGKGGDASASDYEAENLSRAHLRLEELRRKLGDSLGRFEGSEAGRIQTISAIQARLQGEREAVISYLVGSRAVFIVAVTGKLRAFIRVEFESGLVQAMCDTFLESISLDLSTGSAPAFNVQQALSLYDVLIRPLEKYLDDVTHLLIVPDGPLWSISFEALLRDLEAVEVVEDVTDDGEDDDQDDFAKRLRRMRRAVALQETVAPCAAISRADAWLGSRYAVSVLPTITVLSGRDNAPRGPRPNKSFIGFGNPLFRFPPAEEGTLGTEEYSTAGVGTVAFVPLPQTERLLDQIAKILGADLETDVIVRADASVRRVLELNEAGELANRHIICFATHAVYPTADGDPLQESGLVLAGADAEVPDILSASQVRRLRLNTDFVLLTACFTGAPAGKSINIPLSGLAQSFFTAGAKCLLVSHWPVDVYATEELVRAMFSGGGKEENLAEALQRAADALRKNALQSHFAHPVYWAGFSIVGDGGARIWSI